MKIPLFGIDKVLGLFAVSLASLGIVFSFVLMLSGCNQGNAPANEVVPGKSSRLTLIEKHTGGAFQPGFFVYHDSETGTDIAVFTLSDRICSSTLPAKDIPK